jgi:hypothetical protein
MSWNYVTTHQGERGPDSVDSGGSSGTQFARSIRQATKETKGDGMPSIQGSFSGKITKQSAMALTDQPNHEMSIAEVSGTQTSADPLWNDSKISYWGVTDLLNGQGSQHGYFNNVHGDKGRDWGTFEGKVTAAGGAVTVEGTYKFSGGDGELRGLTGGGKFKTVLKSETELECTWEGNYELAKAQTR